MKFSTIFGLTLNPLNPDDTIVALSTPAGIGAMGVIRLSGPQAIALAGKLFTGLDIASAPSHTLHFGIIHDGDEVVDEAVAGLFRAPRSYTTQDVVEISCHGSPYIIQRILQLLIKYGARPAQPGEFTMRAFFNGRLDLSQAEAVSDLIAAETAAAHHIAINQMRGGYSNELKVLREKLLNFASLLELELDFSEEDVEFANRMQLIELLDEMEDKLKRLSESFRLGNVLKNGVSTVIAGKPNAGKSTLLNTLLNEERAIVSEIAGTTRDTLEEIMNISGIAFRLTDTAGIREASDIIEKKGVERTMQKIKQAAIIIYLFDMTEMDEDIKHWSTFLGDAKVVSSQWSEKNSYLGIVPVANKMDLSDKKLKMNIPGILYISAKSGEGIEALKAKLYEIAMSSAEPQQNIVLSNIRHLEALQSTLSSIDNARAGIINKISGELVASDIRSALNHLGEITGEVTTDDLLGNIFGKFCIGK